MSLPWETIFGAAGGSAAVTVLGVLFVQRILEKVVDTTANSFESALSRAEETHKKQLELAGGIDLDLRERRKNVYADIWGKMKLLPKWPRAAAVRYEDLAKLGETFRDWYFDGGGMYLSTNAREAFGQVQDTLAAVTDKKKTGTISPEDYEAVRAKCSAFRTALTNDLLSRRAAPLA